MKTGPRYKIARRLGASVFDKTQTQKFAIREGQRVAERRGRPKSDFGIQMLEKQRARFTYGMSERQFSKYVKESLAKKGTKSDELLYEKLETRLDNVVYRLRLVLSRQAARQMVAHGHIMVNGIRVTVPSYHVAVGDKVAIREASAKKPLFAGVKEKLADVKTPSWIKLDYEKVTAEIQGKPKLSKSELQFDIDAILEFYRR